MYNHHINHTRISDQGTFSYEVSYLGEFLLDILAFHQGFVQTSVLAGEGIRVSKILQKGGALPVVSGVIAVVTPVTHLIPFIFGHS